MKNRTIWIIGGVILILAAGALVIAKQFGGSNPVASGNIFSNSSAEKKFNPKPTSGLAYEGVFTYSSSAANDMIFKNDGKGNKMVEVKNSAAPNSAMTIYQFDKELIQCAGTACSQMTSNVGVNVFDSSSVDYSPEKIASFARIAKEDGTEKCGDMTCVKWNAAVEPFTYIFYIGKDDNKIHKIDGKSSTVNWEINYTYKDIVITKPADVQQQQTASSVR